MGEDENEMLYDSYGQYERDRPYDETDENFERTEGKAKTDQDWHGKFLLIHRGNYFGPFDREQLIDFLSERRMVPAPFEVVMVQDPSTLPGF